MAQVTEPYPEAHLTALKVRRVYIDFETFSECDLKLCGLHVYARHVTTGVYCCAYAFDDGPIKLWTMFDGGPPQDLLDAVAAGAEVWAWNCPFDRDIWIETAQWPFHHMTQFRCSMQLARAMGLPGALDKAFRAVTGSDVGKDLEGQRLMLKMCKPPYVYLPDDDQKMADVWRLGQYCKRDLEIEREMHHYCWPLSEREQQIRDLTEIINERGICVDTAMTDACATLIEENSQLINAELFAITGGAVERVTQRDRLLAWMRANDVQMENLQKQNVLRLMDSHDDGEIEMAPDCRRALELRWIGSKTSIGKLKRIKHQAYEGRLYGQLTYCGAGQTKRWSSQGVQFHNMPRSVIGPAKLVRELFLSNDPIAVPMIETFFESLPHAVSKALRLCLIARSGYRLMGGDFSQIEARIVQWLAGGTDVLEAFEAHDRDPTNNPDVYTIQGDEMSVDRQHGKIAVLSMGFEGGANALQVMGRNYGIEIERNFATLIKNKWRMANPKVVDAWKIWDEGIVKAMSPRQNGKPVELLRGVRAAYLHNRGWLVIQLPTGAVLPYPFARLEDRDTPSGGRYVVTHMTTKGGGWWRRDLYGGLTFQNTVQALAREVMADALLRVERAHYRPVLTVHDEGVSEVPNGFGSLDEYRSMMSVRPEWAPDLPVVVDCWEGPRYSKG